MQVLYAASWIHGDCYYVDVVFVGSGLWATYTVWFAEWVPAGDMEAPAPWQR